MALLVRVPSYELIDNSHAIFTIEVTLHTGEICVSKKRYRQLREFHEHIRLRFASIIPSFPGKKLFGNNSANFLLNRQNQLQKYLQCVFNITEILEIRYFRKFFNLDNPQVPMTEEINDIQEEGQNDEIVQDETNVNIGPKLTDEEILEEFTNSLFDLSISPEMISEEEENILLEKYAPYQELFDNFDVGDVSLIPTSSQGSEEWRNALSLIERPIADPGKLIISL